MDNKEKVISFGEMAEATQKLNRPWIIFCGLLLAALVLSNALWAFVHYKQLKFAYETPVEFEQGQQFEQQTQTQSYSEGATPGE